jgi:hypothetical protein
LRRQFQQMPKLLALPSWPAAMQRRRP